MQFFNSLSLAFLSASAASAVVITPGAFSDGSGAPKYISNEGGRDCATRVTDAYGNSGCTLHEIVNGTPIKILPGTTVADGPVQTEASVIQVFGGTTIVNGQTVGIATPTSGSGGSQVTNIQVVNGQTMVNGQTVGAGTTGSTHNAAPLPTKGPSGELAMIALAAGGILAAL